MKGLNLAAIVFVGALGIFSSCDTIPYKEAYEKRDLPVDTGATEYAKQMVLIEDYTGHTCGNCPIAAKEANRLLAKYPDQVVVMGVHCTYFAKPKNLSSGAFKEDFRTATGDALDVLFNVGSAGLPKGLINRRRFGGASVSILNDSDWESRLVQILEEPTPAIKVELNPTFNTGNGILTVNSNLTFQKGFEGRLKMAMYLTEDSIVSWQKVYGREPEDQPDYIHRHVLRSELQVEGDAYLVKNGSPIAIQETASATWSTSVASKVKIKNCHVILILFDPETNEIVQVGEEKVSSL